MGARPGHGSNGEYNPVINLEDFVAEINNKYFTLKPVTKFTHKNKVRTERIEVTVTDETKKLMGVTTKGVPVTEWKNGLLQDDTADCYAQNKAGNPGISVKPSIITGTGSSFITRVHGRPASTEQSLRHDLIPSKSIRAAKRYMRADV